MRSTLRILLVLALGCLLPLGPVTAPAGATTTPTVQSLTAFPQVGGELTLLTTSSDPPPPAAVVIERWAPGPVWTRVSSSARLLPDGRVAITVPLAEGPMATAGAGWVRLVVAGADDRPAATSEPLAIYVFANASPPFGTAPLPVVTGSHTVGSVLQATTGTWSPAPSVVGLQWNRDGARTTTTGASYTVTAADLGHVITVSAVAFPSSGSSSTFTVRDSRPVAAVTRGTFTAPPPVVVGRAALGETLRADIGAWQPTPATVSYRWSRDGVAIDGADAATHDVVAADAGSELTVTVRAEADGVEPVEVTSASVAVPDVLTPGPRLGDLMQPADPRPLPPDAAQVTTTTTTPAWTSVRRTRWDDPVFAHAHRPAPFLTLTSAMFGQDWTHPEGGAEYDGTNASLKNIDVTFTVTARRFAIAYRGTRSQDAMVWLDDRPVAAQPIMARSSSDTAYTSNWIVIELPTRRTTRVRFAGPFNFLGVDTPAADNAVLSAPEPTLRVGVVSDSFFDHCAEAVCMSRAAAPTLGTLTGWRVWNLAESGTGYLSPSNGPTYGEFRPGVFGSARRLAAVRGAPLDLLLVNGSVNDASAPSYSPQAHRAAVDAYLDDLARIRPDLPVVLVGIEPLGRFQSSPWDERARAMNTTLALTVGRHPNVIAFIDPYTDRWLTGTGSIASPRGDGNQDHYVGTDGVHPSVAGVAYYVGRIVDELRDVRLP